MVVGTEVMTCITRLCCEIYVLQILDRNDSPKIFIVKFFMHLIFYAIRRYTVRIYLKIQVAVEIGARDCATYKQLHSARRTVLS